jgi:hypothetical protein
MRSGPRNPQGAARREGLSGLLAPRWGPSGHRGPCVSPAVSRTVYSPVYRPGRCGLARSEPRGGRPRWLRNETRAGELLRAIRDRLAQSEEGELRLVASLMLVPVAELV